LQRKMHKPWRQGYKIKNQEVHFIIDGIDLDNYYNDKDEVITSTMTSGKSGLRDILSGITVLPNDNKRYQYIKGILDYFTAKDIIGIEFMSSAKYVANYNTDFERYRERMVPGRTNEFAYIEITTRAGKGPFMHAVPGTYLQRSLGFTLPKQFYSPKYNINNSNLAIGTDMRSTLHWEPNVITDKDGKATVSFFSADKISPYTVIVEGTDMNGNLGYKKQVIGLAK
jgi:hypothetical protein